jgi:hypothetical protein
MDQTALGNRKQPLNNIRVYMHIGKKMVGTGNTTIFSTKSGTKVYVVGNNKDKRLRERVGEYFIKYFNRNFTINEQEQIGNIFYDTYNRYHNMVQNPPVRIDNKDWIAQTGTFSGPEAKQLNPRHKKMVDITFLPEAHDDETAITHEMIHARKFMRGVKGRFHNERQIDFEMIGRISQKGVKSIQNGYYFSPAGNPYLAQKQGVSLEKKGEIAKDGVMEDRRLLTGSVTKSVIGKPIEKKSNRLFRKSFFFKRV